MVDAESRRSAEPVQRYLVPNWHSARMERALVRVETRLRRRRHGARMALALAAALAMIAVTVLVIGRKGALSPRPAPELTAVDAHVLRFSDGSLVRLEDDASHVDAAVASRDGIEVTLRSGSARFEVAPQRGRHFVVHAGSVDVVVIGTVFRVERADGRVRVGVEHGRVEVRWPDGVRALSAQESGWFPPEPSAAPAPPEPTPEPEPRSAPVLPDPRSERARFVEHVNRGEYDEAFALLERAPDVVGNSVGELLLAADAARLSNHPAQASTYLERITREHPHDARTPLAAFTLGRILMSQLSRPGRAADAFALARRLAPAGPLAEDALAREAEAAELSGNRERARGLSEEYVRRYPAGRRLRSVQIRGLPKKVE